MIVGFTGYARSGKDTAAKAFIDETLANGSVWHRLAFADALKIEVMLKNIGVRMLVDEWGWEVAKDLFGFIRPILQEHGMKRRAENPDYWVKRTMEVIDTEGGNWVITDCRFENEVSAVRDRGGIVVRVDRPGIGPANDHPSETNVAHLPYDYVVTNDGTVEGLHRRINRIIEWESV